MRISSKIISAKQLPFILLTTALAVFLVCLPLFQDGMFIDGIQYAAVARNLARGVGSFWNPVLAQNSVAGLNSFHEHPPLVFFIQALFFKAFGLNSIYPERIYCLFTFLVTACFIGLIWRKIFEGKGALGLWWLPIALWLLMPVVFWSYANDIQENTMGMFTTTAIYFLLCAADSKTALFSLNFYGGMLCVLAAAFSKGVPGLFPLGFFFIYWLSLKKIKFNEAVVYSIAAISFITAIILIVLQNPLAKEALHLWFFDRMLKRISSDPVESSHFHILIGLLTEQLIAIGIVVLALVVFKWKKVKNDFDKSYAALFVLLGFSASLPLMLTLVQRDFYFTPALPWFAIAWALLIADGLNRSINLLTEKVIKPLLVFASMVVVAGIIVTGWLASTPKRDKQMLQDVYTLQKQIPQNSFVSVTSDIMWRNWSFRCYMMRYNSISFTDKDTCGYFVGYKTDKAAADFVQIDAPLNLFAVYKRK